MCKCVIVKTTDIFFFVGYNGNTPQHTYKGGKGMIAKKNLQTQFKKMWGEEEAIPWDKVVQLAQVFIHFFIAAIFSGGVLFGVASPLGLAVVGASGAGLSGGAALVGAVFGYLSLHSFSQGLRYVSACILVFSLWFCFYDVRLFRKPNVIAGLTGLINAITSYIYLNHGGWTPSEVILYLAEIVVTVLATWACTITLLPLRLEDKTLKFDKLPPRIAGTVFICCLLVSLSGIFLLDDISFGKILAVVLILSFAWHHGSGVGAILGVTTGLALDLASLEVPIYAMAWGFSGMCAGFFQNKLRFHCGLAFLLANGSSVLWALEETSSFSILYEVFLGTAVFILLPSTWLDWCQLPMADWDKEFPDTIETQTIANAKKQLEDSASVFRLLGETLKTAFRPPDNKNDVAVIFDRTASKVCQKCYQWGQCWEKDYVSTFNAMNDATPPMIARGKALAEDFPPYFSHRCLHFPQYLEEVNLQLTGLFYRRQYNSRVRESRVAVCAQYGQLANLLSHASTQISQELTPQLKKSKKLSSYLSYLGLDTTISLQENQQGLLLGDIVGEGTEILESNQGLEELSQLLGVPLSLERKGDILYLKQLEPFMAVAGFASSRKEGEEVSGDQSTFFKREDGKLFVLVCDGMGSGTQARGESSLASQLLEQFLKVGVDTLQALSILSSALALRGEDQGGFTTVDLLEVDLLTAKAILYKYGAAPTYLKRGKEIQRLTGNSLPAGADFGEQSVPDQIKLDLEPEDCLLLVSDGISGALEEDNWLCELLQQFDGRGVRSFARTIIDKTPDANKDDCTSVVVKLGNRVMQFSENKP